LPTNISFFLKREWQQVAGGGGGGETYTGMCGLLCFLILSLLLRESRQPAWDAERPSRGDRRGISPKQTRKKETPNPSPSTRRRGPQCGEGVWGVAHDTDTSFLNPLLLSWLLLVSPLFVRTG